MFGPSFIQGTEEFSKVIDVSTIDDGDINLSDFYGLTSASYDRLGPDLVIKTSDGSTILLKDFFNSASLSDIVGADNIRIPAHIVELLAGSRTPNQFAQVGDVQGGYPVGTVDTADGNVFAVRADGTRVQLSAGDPIYQGDTLETGEDGIIGVTFVDESTLALDEGARLVIDELVYDPSLSEGSAAFFVLQGTMSFVSGQLAKVNPDAVSLETPIATIGIRGTSVLVSFDEPEDEIIQDQSAPGRGGGRSKMSVFMMPEANDAGGGEISVGEVVVRTASGASRVINDSFSGVAFDGSQTGIPVTQTVSLGELGNVFARVILASPSVSRLPGNVRQAVEKVSLSAEAEKAQVIAEARLNAVTERVEQAQATAQAKAAEAAAAESQAEALNEAAELAQTPEEAEALLVQAAALMAASEAAATAALRAQSAVQKFEVLVQAAEQEFQASQQKLQQTQQDAEEAVLGVANDFGDANLAGDTNLTGNNVPFGRSAAGRRGIRAVENEAQALEGGAPENEPGSNTPPQGGAQGSGNGTGNGIFSNGPFQSVPIPQPETQPPIEPLPPLTVPQPIPEPDNPVIKGEGENDEDENNNPLPEIPLNQAPVVSGPVTLGSGSKNTAQTITASDLLGNASDPDGDVLTVQNLSVNYGSLVNNGDGTWTFTPDTNFTGMVTFSYAVFDGSKNTPAEATSYITNSNAAPSVSGPVTLAAGTEDTAFSFSTAQLLANASDTDGDTLSIQNLSADSGSLVDNGDGTWTLTPDADFNGTVTLSYDVSDGTATTATTATKSLSAVNDAPSVSGPVSLSAGTEDTPIIVSTADLLANATDVDGDTLTIQNLSSDHGNLGDNGDGTWTVVPDNDFNGTVTFSYDVSDGTATTATTASKSLSAVNDAPTDLSISNLSISENDTAATVGTLSSTDVDTSDTHTYSIVSDPSNLFEISGTTLKLKAGVSADYETSSTHNVTVRSTDAGGETYDEVLTVSITDVAEQHAISMTDGMMRLSTIGAYSGGLPINHYTVEAWVKIPTSSPVNATIFSTVDNGSNNWIMLSTLADGTLRAYYDGGADFLSVDSSSTVAYDTWTHVAMTYNASTLQLKLHINGAEVGSTSVVATDMYLSASEIINIGTDRLTTTAGYFHGEMAELRFWYSDKSTDIANASYRETQLNGNETGLMVYAPFDQTSGTTALIKSNYTADSNVAITNIDLSTTASHSWETNTLQITNGSDPIVLDLDGDGVELVNRDAGFAFDVDADGLIEQTGWAASDDGVLVMDINEDGVINDMTEVVSHYFNYLGRNDDGLFSSHDVLSLYDDNLDGEINNRDQIFNHLKVWQDQNQDGVTNPDELLGLEELGIVSLSLDMFETDATNAGNRVTGEGGFTFVDGTQGAWNEVQFATRQESENTNNSYVSTHSEAGLSLQPELNATNIH